MTVSEAEAHYARSYDLWKEGRAAEALAANEASLALRPDFAEAHYNRGAMLQALNRHEDAVAAFDRALALRPALAQAWNNRGCALAMMGRFAEAVESYDRLLRINPRDASAWYNRGTALQALGQWDQAIACFTRTLQLNPGHIDAFGCLASAALHSCDLKRCAELAPELETVVREGRAVVPPLAFLGYSGDPALQRRCAQTFIAATVPPGLEKFPPRALVEHDRIRIAYLSADFHDHATAHLAAELFERHDRARFEIHGVSFGQKDGSPMRRRLMDGFDGFHDIAAMSDLEAANLLRKLEIDIAVDLKGHTHGARPAILAHRPSPVQVNYLGYPGTMGCDFIDYVVADAIVAPGEDAPFFSEKIVHLPGSYQVNDSRRPQPAAAARTALALPPDAFVFCSFNNSWKITQPVFEVWMRLLRAVEGSVLWLLADNDSARRNLCQEAEARGVVSSRLVFAPRLPLAQHLARYGAADLFLDTLPCNAHTTASDALWMGLPLLTCRGSSFSGRVAASLLQAIGLPELVTHTLAEYESQALALARDADRLGALKSGLVAARDTAALFRAEDFCRGLEAAYVHMWNNARAGLPPQSFSV